MEVAVTLRTRVDFESLEDINEAYEILTSEMAPDEILNMALNQGYNIQVDID